jgi:antitoxin component YwqK of YwqJK toxin-antitoxin module
MRFLFALFSLLITLWLFISCENIPSECPSIKYDGDLTTLDGLPYSGSCSTFYKESKKHYSIQRYKQGRDHGEWLFYFENGNLMTKGSFDYGKKIGPWLYFYGNGKIHKQHFYDSEGNRSGVWKTFSESGEVLSINQSSPYKD